MFYVKNYLPLRLLKAGLTVPVLLYLLLFTNVQDFVVEAWEKGIAWRLVVIFMALGGFMLGPWHLFSLLNKKPLLVVSKAGVELNSESLKWDEISNVELLFSQDPWRSFKYVRFSCKYKPEIDVDITNADQVGSAIMKNINLLSGRSFKYEV